MANGILSDAFADLLLEAWLTKNTAILPDSLWFGMTLALPTNNNGTGIVAPTAAEYGRVQVVAQGASWVSLGAGSRSMRTANDIVYATAGSDYGQILGYTMHDAQTAGMFLGYGVTNPYVIAAGMTPRLPAGGVVITMPATG